MVAFNPFVLSVPFSLSIGMTIKQRELHLSHSYPSPPYLLRTIAHYQQVPQTMKNKFLAQLEPLTRSPARVRAIWLATAILVGIWIWVGDEFTITTYSPLSLFVHYLTNTCRIFILNKTESNIKIKKNRKMIHRKIYISIYLWLVKYFYIDNYTLVIWRSFQRHSITACFRVLSLHVIPMFDQ